MREREIRDERKATNNDLYSNVDTHTFFSLNLSDSDEEDVVMMEGTKDSDVKTDEVTPGNVLEVVDGGGGERVEMENVRKNKIQEPESGEFLFLHAGGWEDVERTITGRWRFCFVFKSDPSSLLLFARYYFPQTLIPILRSI